MTEQAAETRPATVSEATQQAGEAQPTAGIRARWDWVEPTVWTERMLTALEQGVRGGKWFRLIDKVYALPNLRRGFERVKANRGAAGVDQGAGGWGQTPRFRVFSAVLMVMPCTLSGNLVSESSSGKFVRLAARRVKGKDVDTVNMTHIS